MDTNHPYSRYAEKVNGRLAMLGLIIATINYVLFTQLFLHYSKGTNK